MTNRQITLAGTCFDNSAYSGGTLCCSGKDTSTIYTLRDTASDAPARAQKGGRGSFGGGQARTASRISKPIGLRSISRRITGSTIMRTQNGRRR